MPLAGADQGVVGEDVGRDALPPHRTEHLRGPLGPLAPLAGADQRIEGGDTRACLLIPGGQGPVLEGRGEAEP